MQDSHSCDPGSIPGRRKSFSLFSAPILRTPLPRRDLCYAAISTQRNIYIFIHNIVPIRTNEDQEIPKYISRVNAAGNLGDIRVSGYRAEGRSEIGVQDRL